MTIYCLGSINIDNFYAVPHLPAPGETIVSSEFRQGLGGKGVNQSVAANKAGSEVRHVGAVGRADDRVLGWLQDLGLNTDWIARISETETGHANVTVDAHGENAIVIAAGANATVRADHPVVRPILDRLGAEVTSTDTLMLQNEIPAQPSLAKACRDKGARVIYSAAPFEGRAVREILPYITTLVVNAVEAEQLSAELETDIAQIPVPQLLVTRGPGGAEFHSDGQVFHARPVAVEPVDTTGAGDTFAGYFAAGLDQGMSIQQSLDLAAKAAALKVSRSGTADAIPTRAEVDAFR